MLRPCDRFGRYGNSYLKRDPTELCGTRRHALFVAFGGLMTAVWTVGIPLCLTGVVYANRAKIDPPGKDEITKRRTRLKDKSIRAIDFLWKDYRPYMLYAEPVLLVLRACILGVLAFCGKDGSRAASGTFFSLIMMNVAREVQPFQDRFTNMFARATRVAGRVPFESEFRPSRARRRPTVRRMTPRVESSRVESSVLVVQVLLRVGRLLHVRVRDARGVAALWLPTGWQKKGLHCHVSTLESFEPDHHENQTNSRGPQTVARSLREER